MPHDFALSAGLSRKIIVQWCQPNVRAAARMPKEVVMKANSSTVAPLGNRPVADTASQAPAAPSRPAKRTLGFTLPVLGRRLGMRPSTPEVRAPLQRLEQFSARHAQAQAQAAAPAPAPARVTLAQLLREDPDDGPAAPKVTLAQILQTKDADDATPVRADTPPAPAPAERPKTYGKLASGPKIDCMADMLTSIHCLDDQQVSHITEALGMGPVVAPGRERDVQLRAAGRLLRAPLENAPPRPDGTTIGRTQFGRGLPPDVRDALVDAANSANCYVSEREVTGRDGKTENLLQVHFANWADRDGEPLASQPDSAAYRAVQRVAARFAEALSPILRTDEKAYRIEYVASHRVQGGSADVFTDHLARHMPMTHRPESVALTADHNLDTAIRTSRLFGLLPAGERETLVRAAHVAHMTWDEHVGRDEHGNQRLEVRVMFGGTQNMRDVKQAFSSIGQSVGKVFRANHEAAVLVAKAVEVAHAKGRNVKFDYIAGGSMGGASAQLFAAALESRVKLHDPAPLILFDPQLPNEAQAQHAVKDGKHGYDYAKPRGIAITLDYAERSRKSLMGRMKGLGFKAPGLVRLKLGLSAYDRVKRLPDGGTELRPPRTSGPPGMGYHADEGLYKMAINRFTGLTGLRR
jgi:hypothetical protein